MFSSIGLVSYSVFVIMVIMVSVESSRCIVVMVVMCEIVVSSIRIVLIGRVVVCRLLGIFSVGVVIGICFIVWFMVGWIIISMKM